MPRAIQMHRHIVDREIFTVKNFRVDKFLRFVRSVKFFLTVDSYIMDERLERS